MYRRLFLALASSVAAQLFQFLSFGLALYVLSATELGVYSLALGFQAGLALLMSCGLRQVCTLDYFHMSDTNKKLFIGEVSGTYLLLAVPATLILILNGHLVNNTLFLNTASISVVVATVLAAFLLFYADFAHQLLSYQNKLGVLLAIRGITQAMALLMVFGRTSVAGFLWVQVAMLLAQVIAGMVYLPVMPMFAGLRASAQLLMRGLVFLPSLVAAWGLASAVRWLVAVRLGLAVAAQYALLEGAALVGAALVLTPLGMSYVPMALEYCARFPEKAAQYDRRARRYTLLTLVCATPALYGGFWLLQPVLLFLVPSQYHVVVPLVPVRLLSVLCLAGSYITTCYIQLQKKVGFLVGSLVATALCAIGVVYLCSAWWGLSGVVWALAGVHLGYFAATYWYNARLHRVCALYGVARVADRAGSPETTAIFPGEPLQEKDQAHSNNSP